MADSIHLAIARWSNSVKKYYVLPSPRYDIAKYVIKLQSIIGKEKIDHLIPTCEEAFYISMHKEKFTCKVWTADMKVMHALHNKLTFTAFAEAYLPIPETKCVDQFVAWNQSELYVFKPIYSRFASTIHIGEKLTSNSFSEREKRKWIAQKRIKGKEICIYSIWDNGKLKGYTAYHPLYRVGKGSGIFFEPIKNEQLMLLVKKFGEMINYTGQLSFDVILEEITKAPYFIECNPRGISGAHLLHEQISDAFMKNDCIIVHSSQEYAIKYGLALLYPLSFFKKRIRVSKDIIYRKDDILPLLLQVLSLLEITYLKFKKRISWLEATTGNIEWNGYEN